VFLYLGVLLKQVYDIPLFVPLWLEERMSPTGAASVGAASVGAASAATNKGARL